MASVTRQEIDAATGEALTKLALRLQAESVDNTKAQLDAYKADIAAVEIHRAAIREHNAAVLKTVQAQLAVLQQQASVLDAGSTRGELVQQIFRMLAPNYMKGGTQTLPESQSIDAVNDGRYLEYALREAIKAYDTVAASVGVPSPGQ